MPALPEERNRVMFDHVSDLLCAATEDNVANLRAATPSPYGDGRASALIAALTAAPADANAWPVGGSALATAAQAPARHAVAGPP